MTRFTVLLLPLLICTATAHAAELIASVDRSRLNSGETGIYSEFQFEGAVISANVVDGATNGISVVNFNEGGRLATVTGMAAPATSGTRGRRTHRRRLRHRARRRRHRRRGRW